MFYKTKSSVSIAGTGFIAKGIYRMLAAHGSLRVHKVLTRRPIEEATRDFPQSVLTNSVDECLENTDIFVECTGDPIHAANTLIACAERGIPAATMNPEAQITVATALVRQGAYITDCLGDQPGCLAQLHNECKFFGLDPLCYVNLKGFLDPDPTPEAMEHWSEKQGLSLEQTTSFTDGTKLQVEQALVANGLGAEISKPGMEGPEVADLADLDDLAKLALSRGTALADWALNPGGPPGVLVLARSEELARHPEYTPHARLQTKEGTAFRILRPHHLTYVEALETLVSIAAGKPPLINNGIFPSTTVVAIAKRDLPVGTYIEKGIGSFDLRGEARTIDDAGLDYAPITLVANARMINEVPRGEAIRFSDIEIPDTAALRLYQEQFEEYQPRASVVEKVY